MGIVLKPSYSNLVFFFGFVANFWAALVSCIVRFRAIKNLAQNPHDYIVYVQPPVTRWA